MVVLMDKQFDRIDIIFIVLISLYLLVLVIGILWIILDKIEKKNNLKVFFRLWIAHIFLKLYKASINRLVEAEQKKKIETKACRRFIIVIKKGKLKI